MKENRFSFADEPENGTRAKVVGIGNAGCNAINWMIHEGLCGLDMIAMNTDIRSLQASLAPYRVQIGRTVTQGSSAGFEPETGRKAAEEDRESIHQALDGANMVILIAGMGRGTGQGASPIVAQAARESGALTLAIVTKPFAFEGKARMQHAETGIAALKEYVDAMIVIPGQLLMPSEEPKTTLVDAYHLIDDFLCRAVRGLGDFVSGSGPWNLEFAVLRSALKQRGNVLLSVGAACGDSRATQAIEEALSSPLLEDVSIRAAHHLLVNFSGGQDMTLSEVKEATDVIFGTAGENADVRVGAVINPAIHEGISVTLIASGLNGRLPTVKAINGDFQNGFRHPPSRTHKSSPIRRLPIVVGEDSLPLNNSEPSVPDFLRR
ncbi:MAG: cell division protein FtsZ [bacterium]